MLFEGWELQLHPKPGRTTRSTPQNNINGINGDANGDKKGLEVNTRLVDAPRSRRSRKPMSER